MYNSILQYFLQRGAPSESFCPRLSLPTVVACAKSLDISTVFLFVVSIFYSRFTLCHSDVTCHLSLSIEVLVQPVSAVAQGSPVSDLWSKPFPSPLPDLHGRGGDGTGQTSCYIRLAAPLFSELRKPSVSLTDGGSA